MGLRFVYEQKLAGLYYRVLAIQDRLSRRKQRWVQLTGSNAEALGDLKRFKLRFDRTLVTGGTDTM